MIIIIILYKKTMSDKGTTKCVPTTDEKFPIKHYTYTHVEFQMQ